jgi:hypothetical protein
MASIPYDRRLSTEALIFMDTNTKLCSKCNEEFPLSIEFFQKHSKTKSGFGSYCKSCQKKYRREYFEQNREKSRQQVKNHYHNNIDQKRQWYRDWYKKNQKKVQAGQTILRRNKRRNNLQYRLACNLRNRLNKALKNITKSESTKKLLGCTMEELKTHLQNQFSTGMSWDNYGKWHIDHIRPCASFDLSDPEQVNQCFHYSNLQPLWAIDNFKKSDSWDANPNSI